MTVLFWDGTQKSTSSLYSRAKSPNSSSQTNIQPHHCTLIALTPKLSTLVFHFPDKLGILAGTFDWGVSSPRQHHRIQNHLMLRRQCKQHTTLCSCPEAFLNFTFHTTEVHCAISINSSAPLKWDFCWAAYRHKLSQPSHGLLHLATVLGSH